MIKTGLFIFIACAGASCSAPEIKTTTKSAQSENVESKSVEAGHLASGHVESEGKPGAAVSFSHALKGAVAPQGAGVLTLSIDKRLDSGRIAITATADGLDLAASSRATTFSLEGPSPHLWDVFFDAPDAGVYYIDFAATVTDERGGVSTRSYSAAVQVGAAAALSKPDADVALDGDGNPVMIMEAEESVEE